MIARYRLGALMAALCVVPVLATLVGVAVVYRDEIAFSPSDFVNEGCRFMMGVLSMLFGFWVSEVYWEAKTERGRVGRVWGSLGYYLNSTARVIVETSEALARPIQADDESTRRDQEALANLRRLGDARANTLNLLDTSRSELRVDDRLAVASAYFRSEVAPVLARLSACPRVRPNTEAIRADLALVGNEIETILAYLRGERDEPGPTRGQD